MDKISGIIPASPRVTKVDLSDSPGIRATLPNAERVVGAMSTMTEQVQGTPQWRAKETRQAQVAAEVSNNFFMKAKPSEESEAESEAPARQPQGLFPKGSFIDRSA